MRKFKKRGNGKGSAVYLGNNRSKPFAARISIGKDINGINIYYDIGTFETELEALVCLENYHKNPSPLYIKEKKYNRIITFPPNPYPLVPVINPNQEKVEKIKKDNYTFKQLFKEFEKNKMLTKEEQQIEKIYHIRPKNKPFGRNYCRGLITAYHNSVALYDKVYKDLRASDFMEHLKKSGKGSFSQRQMVNLFQNLDKYALEEDIIDKGYAQFISLSSDDKNVKKAVNGKINKDKPFTYEQIDYSWNLKLRSSGTQEKNKKEREQFIRDLFLMMLYAGTRVEEQLSIYTENVFLDKNYFIGGLKTNAGRNREIPIHPAVKLLYEKYYNPNNEFLFMQPNGKKIDYDYYLYHFKLNFRNLHPEIANHTAHDCRHTLRNELEKLGIRQIIINSIMGHSNENVGQDVYTHISIEEKLEAIKLVTYKEKKLYILDSNQSKSSMDIVRLITR